MKNIYIIMVALLAACTVGGNDKPNAGSRVVVGDRVPAFYMAEANDAMEIFKSPDGFEGKKTLLVLFNRDCGDCQREMPKIKKAAADYPNLQVLAVERAAPNIENPYPPLRFFPDADATIYALFAEHTIPRVYFVEETATIKNMFVEHLPADFEQQLENFIR